MSDVDSARLPVAGRPVWEFWIDVGGTFTDCLAREPGGRLLISKVLSSGTLSGVALETGEGTLTDPGLASLADGVLAGYRLRWTGASPGEAAVLANEKHSGLIRFRCDSGASPAAGDRYEVLVGEPSPLLAMRLLMGRRLEWKSRHASSHSSPQKSSNSRMRGSGSATRSS